jgi:Tfp pilus assembly protein PilF
MGRCAWFAGLALAVGACAPATQERVREYAQDGVHLYHRGAYADARDSFQAALALQPDDPDLTFNLAQCYDRLGQAERAERLYLQCLQRAPDHAECRHALTVLLVRGGKREQAERHVADWYRRSPNLAGPYAEHGWLLMEDGDLDRARTQWQKAILIDPRNNLALIELARYYERIDRPSYAVALYERALEGNPNQPDVARRLRELRASGAGRPRPD